MKYRRVKLPDRKVWSVSEAYALYNEAGEFLGELWHSPSVEIKEPARGAGSNDWFCYFYKMTHNPNLWFGIPPENCRDGHPPQYAEGHRWIDAADALRDKTTNGHKYARYAFDNFGVDIDVSDL